MKNKNLIRFVQALAILPMISVSAQIPAKEAPHNVLVQQLNIASISPVLNPTAEAEAKLQNAKAAAIDAYFKAHNMPLYGTGQKMVEEAEKNGLDWRLLPAIAVRESTGGKFECKTADHNFFGWGSCRVSFKSDEEAIARVALNLGGNNPATAIHYENKSTLEILHAYNPPTIVRHYAEQVMSIMNDIGTPDLTVTENNSNA